MVYMQLLHSSRLMLLEANQCCHIKYVCRIDEQVSRYGYK
jgi:hypothetical protein